MAMVVTFVVAELSYRLVEMPVRSGRLRRVAARRAGRRRTRQVYNRRRWMVALAAVVAGFAGFAGVSIATADNVCVGDLECSLQYAGGTAPPPASVPPAPTTSTTSTDHHDDADHRGHRGRPPCVRADRPPGSTRWPRCRRRRSPGTRPARRRRRRRPTPPPTTVAPSTTTTAPPASVPAHRARSRASTQQIGPAPLAIGESVMQGATEPARRRRVQRRRPAEPPGHRHRRHRRGPPRRRRHRLDRRHPVRHERLGVRRHVRPDHGQPPGRPDAVRVLPHRARPDAAGSTANNERIVALPSRYPNVHVIDWADLSAANGVKFCSDGFHIACSSESAADVRQPDLRGDRPRRTWRSRAADFGAAAGPGLRSPP